MGSSVAREPVSLLREIFGQAVLVISGHRRMMYQNLAPKPEETNSGRARSRSKEERLRMCVVMLSVALSVGTEPVAPLTPRAVVTKAIEAHGGAANLKRYQAFKFSAKGKVYGTKGAADMSFQLACEWPDRARVTSVFESRGRQHTMLVALDGPREWTTVDGKAGGVSKEVLAERREILHADWIASLRPLLDGTMTLASAREERIEGRPAVGVTVSDKGHRPVKLFFDKETGLLLKAELPRKHWESTGEGVEDYMYSGYRMIQGVKFPMRISIRENGKLVAEHERTDVILLERLEQRLFEKP